LGGRAGERLRFTAWKIGASGGVLSMPRRRSWSARQPFHRVDSQRRRAAVAIAPATRLDRLRPRFTSGRWSRRSQSPPAGSPARPTTRVERYREQRHARRRSPRGREPRPA